VSEPLLKPRYKSALGADLGSYAERGMQLAEENAVRQDRIIELLERIANALEARPNPCEKS
jgi:hypothetical protein